MSRGERVPAATGLARKLGLRSGMTVRLVNPPEDYWRKVLGEDNRPPEFEEAPRGATGNFVHAFVEDDGDLESMLDGLRDALHDESMLWISWRKGGRADAGDTTRDTVRGIVLGAGIDLVDVKVCAFDDARSALKFVVRASARGRRPPP
ncbi:MAG: hypothetical protein R3323_08725 [Wenzhouxiangellaceae bacterium]|nr:hypothetical protein [Wenzhouxiangellaceae bacterium]